MRRSASPKVIVELDKMLKSGLLSPMSILSFQWPKKYLYVRAVLVVIGGFLVHLSLGTIYTLGNIAPYIVSYVRNQSHPSSLNKETTTWIFAFALIGQGGTMFVGGWMVKKIGPRWSTLIGGWLMSFGVIMSYFTIKVSFWLLLVTLGIIFGAGVGIAYIGPLSAAMSWMPRWKGFANGIVVAGFGLGASIFNFVQTKYINPQNDKPNGDEYFTDPDLINRVPSLFLILGGTYAIMQLIGSLLITNPPDDYGTATGDPDKVEQEGIFKSGQYREVDDTSVKIKKNSANDSVTKFSLNGRMSSIPVQPQLNSLAKNKDSFEVSAEEERNGLLQGGKKTSLHVNPEERSLADDSISSVMAWSSKNVVASLKPLQVLKKPNFYLLWYMFLANGLSTTFIATLYKFYGLTFLDDHYLAIVGSVSAIFNCLGRIVWGVIADKISYKFSLVVLSGIFTIFILTLYSTSEVHKSMFFIWICIIFFCIGGNFSLFPTATGRAFGLQYVSVNYGLLFTSQIIAGSLGAVLSTVLKTHIGYSGLMFLVSGFTCSTFILSILFKPKRYIALQSR